MKNNLIQIPNPTRQRFLGIFVVLISFGMFIATSCKDDDDDPVNPNANYEQVNLVASTSGYNAVNIDTNLVNAWGMAISPSGSFWISSTEKNRTTVYDRTGLTLLLPITVAGEPTGVASNTSVDFLIPGTALVSKYIYVGEEGSVQSWSTGDAAVEVVDHSASGAVFKGVDIAKDDSKNFLYIANFSQGKIEVLDKNFNPVNDKLFVDPNLPVGFAPFNIKNIDGKLYVMYAKQSADKYDAVSGAGNGFVSIFNTDGTFVKRFASQGALNSPWGIAKAPGDFDQGSNAILIGNFGDGRINVYSKDGEYKGQLENENIPITIDGLWALSFPSNGVPAGDQNQLFFTAGPDNEAEGLFGYIKLK